jgi:hypothetical protein
MIRDGATAGRFRGLHLVPFLCLGALALGVYIATLAPSLVWAHWGSDGGDLVTAAVTGRVSHPPGSPVYHLLARACVLVFRGDPARVLNLLSATMAAGASLLLAATLLRRGLGWPIAGSAALALAFSPWLWSQSVITEVYTTGVFFAVLALYLAEVPFRRAWLRSLLSGLALGLAISVHMTIGALGIYLLLDRQVDWKPFLAGLLMGLVPYLLLPLFGPWPQPWGDLRSLGGWWEFVSARMYWGNAFSLPLASWPRRGLAWFVLLTRQFTPPGMVLVLLGIASYWRQNRRSAVALVATWLPVTFYAVGYNAADSWVYLLAFLPLLALALAEGLRWIGERGIPSWLALAIPLALVLLNWTSLNLRADQEVALWLDRTLDRLPPNALVLTHADRHTFALWYTTDALGLREDLLVVDARLWGYRPYVDFVGARIGVDTPDLDRLIRERSLCDIRQEGEVFCQ